VNETAVAKKEEDITEEQFYALLTKGDLSGLGMSLRAKFLFKLAERYGLDPWRRPFDLLSTKDNRVIVYANKNCAQQIRENLGIKLDITYMGALRMYEEPRDGQLVWVCDPDIYQVVIKATDKDGREEVEMGTAQLAGLDPREKKDAPLKAITRAKRRAILNLGKISLPDESETDFARTPPQRMSLREQADVARGAAAQAETVEPDVPARPVPPAPVPLRTTLPKAVRMEPAAPTPNPRGMILPPPVAPQKPPVR
jgi:hypothetical protein